MVDASFEPKPGLGASSPRGAFASPPTVVGTTPASPPFSTVVMAPAATPAAPPSTPEPDFQSTTTGGSKAPLVPDDDGARRGATFASLHHHEYLPVLLRGFQCVCSLLALALMASQIQRDGDAFRQHAFGFLLAIAVLLFAANAVFAAVEFHIATSRVPTSAFDRLQETTSKLELGTDWALGALGFGAACAAAGVTTDCRAAAVLQADGLTYLPAGGDCGRAVASIVFLFLALLACALPQLVWLVPTLVAASRDGGSQAPTALRWILGTAQAPEEEDAVPGGGASPYQVSEPGPSGGA